MEATEQQKNAYQQQWEAMDERSLHAVRLAEMAPQFLDLLESGKSIAWIEEAFASVYDGELRFSRSEIEFAIIGAMRAREQWLRSLAEKIFNRGGLVEALAKYQAEHGAIALEKLQWDELSNERDSIDSEIA